MLDNRMAQYTDWAIKHLPQNVPQTVVDNGIKNCRYNFFSGLNVMERDDRGPSIVYTAANEEDLRLWWFLFLCESISEQWELFARKENEKKWRFLRATVKNGKWFYIEQKNYKYNAIEDTRLDRFEKYLNLIKPVVSPEFWNKKVEQDTQLMNQWFKEPHWDYDRDKLCFVEISDSREHDTDGYEEPGEGFIVSQ